MIADLGMLCRTTEALLTTTASNREGAFAKCACVITKMSERASEIRKFSLKSSKVPAKNE
jgi:hypothetical protein